MNTMKKVTSLDMNNAINFATSDPQVSRLLKVRNDDNRLDCRAIRSSVISAIDAIVKQFEVLFEYDWIGKDGNKEDVVATVQMDAHGNWSFLALRVK